MPLNAPGGHGGLPGHICHLRFVCRKAIRSGVITSPLCFDESTPRIGLDAVASPSSVGDFAIRILLSSLVWFYLSSRAKGVRSGRLPAARAVEWTSAHTNLPVAVHAGPPGGGERINEYEPTTTGRVLRWRHRCGHGPRPIPHLDA